MACYLLGSLAMFMQTTTGMIVFIICPLLLLVGWDVLRRSMDAKPRRHGQNINPNDIYEKETAMNKRGIIGRLAAVSLALCLVTMSLTSGTLEKYTGSVTGSAKATAAAWAIQFKDGNDTGFNETNKLELNLEDTEKETANLVADDKAAPATKGFFEFKEDGAGTEAAFIYTIELDVSSCSDAPLVFYKGTIAEENKVTATGDVMIDGTNTVVS